MKSRISVVAILFAISITVAACERQPDSTSTKQSKQPPAAAPQGAPAGEMAAEQSELNFTVPDGWKQDPTPRQMREATLTMGEGDKSAEVIVTRLSRNFGEFGANVNRWRQQIGMEPLQDPSSVKPQIVKTPVGDAKVIKLDGSDKASVIALVEQGESTWFFRLTGEKSTVNANEPKLQQLLSSLKVVNQ